MLKGSDKHFPVPESTAYVHTTAQRPRGWSMTDSVLNKWWNNMSVVDSRAELADDQQDLQLTSTILALTIKVGIISDVMFPDDMLEHIVNVWIFSISCVTSEANALMSPSAPKAI